MTLISFKRLYIDQFKLIRPILMLLTMFGAGLNVSFSQVGIGTTSPNSSTALTIESTSQGFLYPRMTTTQMLAISKPVTGLQIYNTNANCMYYYDGQAWVSTLNSISTLADAGDVVQLDNIKIRVSTSGNRSMQISTVSGTITVSGSTYNFYPSTSVGATGAYTSESGIGFASTTIGTSFSYVQSAANFAYHGSVQRFFMNDQTNNKCYRITCIIGNSYLKNTIEIERIL